MKNFQLFALVSSLSFSGISHGATEGKTSSPATLVVEVDADYDTSDSNDSYVPQVRTGQVLLLKQKLTKDLL